MKEVRGPTKLTEKQMAFVRAKVEGKNPSGAYKIAYNTTNMKPSSIARKAHELSKQPNISAMYEELKKEAKERTLWSYERAQEELLEMLEDSKSAKNFMGRHNAIKELNNISGFYDKKKEDKEDKAGSFFDKIGDLI
ncbi:MAG: hypothetical protein ACRCTS_01670 [Fusobacteriaceae bacterium]